LLAQLTCSSLSVMPGFTSVQIFEGVGGHDG
jgi:hypothetical protein